MIGIYSIQNIVNHKFYIGQSVNIKKRWRDHLHNYSNPKSKNFDYPLYKAFRKYGIENFRFEVVEECDIKDLNEKEIYYVQKFDSFYHGYNQTLGGNSSDSFVIKEYVIGVINHKRRSPINFKFQKKWFKELTLVAIGEEQDRIQSDN